MTKQTSPATEKAYPLSMVCRVWSIARSSVYFFRAQRVAGVPKARRRGPAPPHPDDELKGAIREVLADSPFHGEGHRKVWARLRARGIRTSKRRVLRLMRAEGLLAPHHPIRVHGNKAHDRSITTEHPDEMWGTDATTTLTKEGLATIFLAVDHCTAECIGIHATARGDRFEALEPLRQGIRQHFGIYGSKSALGLALRHDHGSQYTSRHFQSELRFLGVRSSPAFVGEPECNGVAERFIRTLKEQLLWVETFETIEQLRLALMAFKDRYNQGWLVQKHGHITPTQARIKLTQLAAQAA